LVGALLLVAAGLSILGGIVASWASQISGPAELAPALFGIGIAVPFVAAGTGLLSGWMPRRALLLCVAAVPVAVVAVSPFSSDLAALLPVLLLGWLWLSWYLGRPLPAEWVGSARR